MKYYLIHVEGCVEPELRGPYANEEEQDQAAKTIRAAQSEEDALFWLNVTDDGTPSVGPYSGGFFEEDATTGRHCPDESCPGVIEDAGECSHCGKDYKKDTIPGWETNDPA
jgi:hypothetical protein